MAGPSTWADLHVTSFPCFPGQSQGHNSCLQLPREHPPVEASMPAARRPGEAAVAHLVHQAPGPLLKPSACDQSEQPQTLLSWRRCSAVRDTDGRDSFPCVDLCCLF